MNQIEDLKEEKKKYLEVGHLWKTTQDRSDILWEILFAGKINVIYQHTEIKMINGVPSVVVKGCDMAQTIEEFMANKVPTFLRIQVYGSDRSSNESKDQNCIRGEKDGSNI